MGLLCFGLCLVVLGCVCLSWVVFGFFGLRYVVLGGFESLLVVLLRLTLFYLSYLSLYQIVLGVSSPKLLSFFKLFVVVLVVFGCLKLFYFVFKLFQFF